MSYRRRAFTRTRSAKRRVDWAHKVSSFGSLATAQSTDLLSDYKGIMGSLALVGITIRRIKLIIQIEFDLTTTVLTQDSGLYCTTHINTGGLASAAVPVATTNPDKDYNFRVWIPATGGNGFFTNTITTQHIVVSREFDIKSMRKLRDAGDTMYFSAIPTGAVGAAWRIEASSLLLLP